MINYIKGEIYRVLRKKSMYIYFGTLAVGYALSLVIRSGGFMHSYLANDALNLFDLLPALVGGYLFAAICTDDLGAKNLATLVGFGMSKTKIVLSKLILITLLSAAVYAVIPAFMYAVHAVLGWPADADAMKTVYALAARILLRTAAFSAVAGILVYGVQRATFAMVLYILLAFGVVSALLGLVLNSEFVAAIAPNVYEHLIGGITDRIFFGMTGGGALVQPIIEYVVYVGIAAALSALAFNKKEMEF